jgi:hypothetical protein
MKMTINVVEWKSLSSGALVGFATIAIAELKMKIHDVGVYQKEDRRWAMPPSKPMVKNGTVVRDSEGAVRYSKVIEFDNKQVAGAFSDAVIEALLRYDPAAFKQRRYIDA